MWIGFTVVRSVAVICSRMWMLNRLCTGVIHNTPETEVWGHQSLSPLRSAWFGAHSGMHR